MTKKETLQMLGHIHRMYPRHFENLTPETIAMNAEIWHEVFEQFSFQQSMEGLKAYFMADTSGFPPVPGQIIDHIVKRDEMTASEAWALVRKAARNSTYHAEEEFDKLPEVVQKVIAAPSELSAMACMESDSMEVMQSHFIRAYNEELKKREYMAKLPESVKALYQKTTPKIERTVIDGRLLIAE